MLECETGKVQVVGVRATTDRGAFLPLVSRNNRVIRSYRQPTVCLSLHCSRLRYPSWNELCIAAYGDEQQSRTA